MGDVVGEPQPVGTPGGEMLPGVLSVDAKPSTGETGRTAAAKRCWRSGPSALARDSLTFRRLLPVGTAPGPIWEAGSVAHRLHRLGPTRHATWSPSCRESLVTLRVEAVGGKL